MQIKTLAEILAESDTDSASSVASNKKTLTDKKSKPSQTELFNRKKSKKSQHANPTPSKDIDTTDNLIAKSDSRFYSDSNTLSIPTKSKKRKKKFHPAANFVAEPNDTPAYKPPEAQSIQQMLAEVKRKVRDDNGNNSNNADIINNSPDIAGPLTTSDYLDTLSASEIDNLPSALKAYLRTPEQKQAEIDAIKAESRLRWLAFYYLSRREHGKAELRQKLIDKEQDLDSIEALLEEFEEKGYQSDYRTTLMLIRENIRKGRGRQRIKQEFFKKKIALPNNIDELIDMANSESDEFQDFVNEDDDSLVEGVDWLKMAVEARTKKYGNNIPTEQKEKAKQLRFLQYRGFKADICFEALDYTLDTLNERF